MLDNLSTFSALVVRTVIEDALAAFSGACCWDSGGKIRAFLRTPADLKLATDSYKMAVDVDGVAGGFRSQKGVALVNAES